jgi:type I restriction enzyme M protein
VTRLGDYIREECNPLGAAGAQDLRLIGVSNEHGLHASSRDTSDDLSRYQRIEKNWFAYNPMRVNVGSIGLADDESKTGFTSPDYTVFSCRKGLDPHYLLHFLKSDYGLEAIARNCSGAVRKRL